MLLTARPIRAAMDNASDWERVMSTHRPGQTPRRRLLPAPSRPFFRSLPGLLATNGGIHRPRRSPAICQVAEGHLPRGVARGVIQVGSLDHHSGIAVEGPGVLHEVEELVETLVLLEEAAREHEMAGRHGALVGAV